MLLDGGEGCQTGEYWVCVRDVTEGTASTSMVSSNSRRQLYYLITLSRHEVVS